MHDHIIGRCTDHCRESVVAEEVRCGSVPIDRHPAHGIELRGGDPGTNGGSDALMHSATTRPACRMLPQFRSGSTRDLVRSLGETDQRWNCGVDGSEQLPVTSSGVPRPSTATSRPVVAYDSMVGWVSVE